MNRKRLLFNKIKQKSGESLAETLISLVIVSMGMIIMAGAIIASARVGMKTNKEYLNSEGAPVIGSASGTVRLTNSSGTGITISGTQVHTYSENGKNYYYWEK